MGRFVVYKDGFGRYQGETYNDCLVWLQREVPYSWDHAMKHEGWTIEDESAVGELIRDAARATEMFSDDELEGKVT